MKKEEIIELDTILELTDTLATQPQNVPHAPHSPLISNTPLTSLSLSQDETVFETLTAPKSSHGASFMPPYDEASHSQVNTSQYDDDTILELDSDSVVHSQYTVTTELFIGSTEQEAKKEIKVPEHIHIDTVHADAMHVGEVHIKSIHANKTLRHDMQILHEFDDAQLSNKSEEPADREKLDGPKIYMPDSIEHDVKDKEDYKETYKEPCQEGKDCVYPYENAEQMLRDISTLKTALASMQLRLAAQESCVASLESRLMVAETKNRELEAQCHKLEDAWAQQSSTQHKIEVFDTAQLEQITATTAARIVREEIKALLELAEQQ